MTMLGIVKVSQAVQFELDQEGLTYNQTGIADYYGAVLPYRFGLIGQEYMENFLNSDLQMYYTSPKINADILDVANDLFTNWYAEKISYARGATYFFLIDGLLRQATGNFDLRCDSPLDEIIVELAERRKRGEIVLCKDWLNCVKRYLGSSGFPVDSHFQGMLRGTTLDLQGIHVLKPFKSLDRCELPIMQFGLDKTSMSTRVVSGVEENSAAAKAGLKDSQEILRNSMASLCSAYPTHKFRLLVREDGQEKSIDYIPRSEKVASSWQVAL